MSAARRSMILRSFTEETSVRHPEAHAQDAFLAGAERREHAIRGVAQSERTAASIGRTAFTSSMKSARCASSPLSYFELVSMVAQACATA